MCSSIYLLTWEITDDMKPWAKTRSEKISQAGRRMPVIPALRG